MAVAGSSKLARSPKAGRGPGKNSERNGAGPERATQRPALNPLQTDSLSNSGEGHGLSRFSDLTLIAFLAAAAALPYWNTLRNGFVADDDAQVLQNPYLSSFHYLAKIFTTQATSYLPGWPNYYRPLMNAGYLLCYQVFGPHPFGFHLFNIVLHVLVVAAVFLITKRMFQNRSLAWMTAALFAIHPIHSEAVAWIAAVPELELSFFFLLTFWFYLGVARPGGRSSFPALIATAGCFLLAIFSKEQALALPVLATLYEHFYRPDREETEPPQKLFRYAALWLLAAVYLLFRVRVLGALGSGIEAKGFTWYQACLSTFVLLGQYLWKVLWPVDLHLFCPFLKPSGLLDPAVIAGMAGLAVCGALFFYLWRRARPLSFGLVWFLVTLAPVLNARWMPVFAFADRYLYLPSVGFCWLLGSALLGLRARTAARSPAWKPALAAGFAILMALGFFRIITRNRDWQNNITLYTNTLAACPDAFYVRRNLGSVYWDQGDVGSAATEWAKVLEVAPGDPAALCDLGLANRKMLHYSRAIEFFKQALESDPANREAHLALGLTYMDTGSLELAEPELCAAVSLSPLNYEARNALGKLYLQEGRKAEAEEQFRRSVEIEPNIMGYSNLGVIYWGRGEVKSAEQVWLEAQRLAPEDSSLLNDLGLVSMNQGNYAGAVSFFRRAIGLNPSDPPPHMNLGMAYVKLGQNKSAEAEFRTALSYDPATSQAHFELGALYLSQGRREEALKEYHAGLRTDPKDPDALAVVHRLYARAGGK